MVNSCLLCGYKYSLDYQIFAKPRVQSWCNFKPTWLRQFPKLAWSWSLNPGCVEGYNGLSPACLHLIHHLLSVTVDSIESESKHSAMSECSWFCFHWRQTIESSLMEHFVGRLRQENAQFQSFLHQCWLDLLSSSAQRLSIWRHVDGVYLCHLWAHNHLRSELPSFF